MAITVVGSINTDLVVRVDQFPIPGETVYGEDFQTFAGGKGANQAAAAAKLGSTVAMFGAVGDDAYSPERLRDLSEARVAVDAVLVRENVAGGIALIQIDRTGQNHIVIVPGANGTVTPADVKSSVPSLLHEGDLVLAQYELPIETVRATLETTRSRGARSIVNTAPFVEEARDLVSLIDILVVNEIEAGQLLGRDPVRVDEAIEACRELRTLGPEIVFATLGASGAVLVDAEGSVSVAAPAVDVVDTTGAGDATVGAFATALSEGASPADAARFAVMAGSYAVQRIGAQAAQASRTELEAFISHHTPAVSS